MDGTEVKLAQHIGLYRYSLSINSCDNQQTTMSNHDDRVIMMSNHRVNHLHLHGVVHLDLMPAGVSLQ